MPERNECHHQIPIELHEPGILFCVASDVSVALVQDEQQSLPDILLLVKGCERLVAPLSTDLFWCEGRSDEECIQPLLYVWDEVIVSVISHIVDVAELLLR